MSCGSKVGLTYEKVVLDSPPIEEVSRVLQTGLNQYFETVDVSVVECPDLKADPFYLAQSGLCGNEKIADVGGPPYLIPLVQRNKIYSFKDIASALQMGENAFLLGASAGPFHVVGTNCELMPNISFESTKDNQTLINNRTHFAKVGDSGECYLSRVDSIEFGLMANLFACEGKPGNVLRINVKKRIGSDNFITSLRNTLSKYYGNRTVSLGGVFLLRSGKAKLHIMPDFSKTPLESDKDVDNWLTFHNMKSPLICLSVFHSHDPGLDLRIEHTHCFSNHGEGGHYHYDTTPEEVEYEAYFNLAKQLYRIDAPIATHNIGRD